MGADACLPWPVRYLCFPETTIFGGRLKRGAETQTRVFSVARAPPRRAGQCVPFPGMRLVFDLLLIYMQWYREVVFESGIELFDCFDCLKFDCSPSHRIHHASRRLRRASLSHNTRTRSYADNHRMVGNLQSSVLSDARGGGCHDERVLPTTTIPVVQL